MRLEVPVQNEDGSLKMTMVLDAPQVQALLQFGINMAMAMGIASQYGLEDEEWPEDAQLN